VPDINLTQDEADKLMAMEKRAADEKLWLFPAPGERVAIPLTSLDKRESFMLDVTRSQIKLTKATYQNRAKAVVILMRLDLDGPLHRNPDGEEVPCPHLHITAQPMATNGQSRPQLTDIRIHLIFTQRSRHSCSIAISPIRLRFREGCSNDDGA
jgi:hypothetical protein